MRPRPRPKKRWADMRATLGKLEDVRRELIADTKAVRDDYRDKMANAAAGSSAAMSLLGRKQKAGQMKADAKRQLRAKRNEALAPYNQVKGSLDRIIAGLGKQATQVQKFADSGKEARPEGQKEAEMSGSSLDSFYFDTPSVRQPYGIGAHALYRAPTHRTTPGICIRRKETGRT